MLGDYELCHTPEVVTGTVVVDLVVFWSVDEAYHVCILLYSSGFTQVAELRPFALIALLVAFLNATVELRECYNGYVKLLGKALQRATDVRHLFLTGAEAHARGIHKLQVVDEDEFDAMLAHEASGLGAELEH